MLSACYRFIPGLKLGTFGHFTVAFFASEYGTIDGLCYTYEEEIESG